ncbi:MAG: leucine-rich repeat domain-containing protein [Ruminococcaceae bacterium]|nr:leucine-rich repeat domain-containing protein [Oscillospiraceae bacterium]
MNTKKMKKLCFAATACLLFAFVTLLASCAPDNTPASSSAESSNNENSELSKHESTISDESFSPSSSETESGSSSDASDEESSEPSDDISTEPSASPEESDVTSSQDNSPEPSSEPGEQENSEDISEPPVHVHEWEEADCENPKTCVTCGETTGTVAGHDWQIATCTSAKTCATCGKTEGSAKGHNWKAATCVCAKTCQVCGATEGEANGHDWQGATCTIAKTCKTCQQTTGNANGHQYLDGVCETCGERDPDYQEPITYSQGLAYQVNEDGKTCSVSIGTCTDADISIPPTIDGYIVTEIGEDAFANCANITSITIPDSVTTISYYPFARCPNLVFTQYEQGLYLGTSTNPYHALVGIASDDTGSVVSFKVHEDTKCIADNTFGGCFNMVSIELPNGITRIGRRMFEDCERLESVHVPGNVTQIAAGAFQGCRNLERVTFEGTVTQWDVITKGNFWNDNVPAAEVVCSDGTVSLA